MKFSNEAKVGALLCTTVCFAFLFAWMIGIPNPFQKTISFYVTYHFAGGLEMGSPVRVAGIKVGKVEEIIFFPSSTSPLTEPKGAVLTPLKIKISVRKEAAQGIRQDSGFYINLAGIIGERYVEITPGHAHSPPVQEGETVVGIDPPRIDQLISQSFNLAGKIQDIIEENKGDITRSIELLYRLSHQLNKAFTWLDHSKLLKQDIGQLVENLIAMSTHLRQLTEKTQTPEGKKTLELLHELLWRLEPLNGEVIRQFFQKEGVKTRLF